MAPTATRTNSNKPRRGGTTATSLLLAAAYTLAAVLILQGLVSPTAAMKMDTANTMDDDADMVEDFAKMVMSESVFAMYDQTTGKVLNNSKASFLNANPDDPDNLDVAMFVDHEDVMYPPGSNQTVQMCDFDFPEACEKKIPYKGAPDDYDCGASDEALPATGFRCTNITAVTDQDGDLSLIDEIDSATPMCVNADGDEEPIDDEPDADAEPEVPEEEEEEEDDDGPTTRRRLLQSRSRRNRNRSFRSGNSYAFGGGGRGNRGRRRTGAGNRGGRRRGRSGLR